MGGREVGGLANQLAAHMGFTPPDIDRVRRFWKAPRIATHEGLKAVQMFEAIARGEIKALWVMAPIRRCRCRDADAVREALKKLELFVVSENVRANDTVDAGAHVLLPAQAWGEKDGTVTNSERRISRQRAFLPLRRARPSPTGGSSARSRKRLGFGAAFAFQSAADIFREHAALSAFENDGAPRFRHRRAEGAVGRGVRRDGAGAMAGRRARRSRRRASSPTAAFSPTTARRASSRRKFRRCAPRPRRRGRCG
jgi:assimilatory nitrate reductase catalytic subunit